MKNVVWYKMKICLTCAAGGHLDQLISIMDAFKEHDIFFVTVKSETTEELKKIAKTYYTKDVSNSIKIARIHLYTFTLALYYLQLILPCIKILLKEKPDVIVGNGGSATLWLSYLGKLMGAKIVYIESLARVRDLSGTGKLIYPIADLFVVQWESLMEKYSKAKYWGKVI